MTKLPRSQVAAVIASSQLGSMPTAKLAREVAAYLMAEHRTGELESLMRDVMQYRADHGIVEVVATSAHALTDQNRKDIRSDIKELYPAAKQIILDEQVDPDVLGVIKLELANQQFDASIRTKLNRFKQLTAAGKD